MGTYTPNYRPTCNLLAGLRGLVSTVIVGVIGALNLQVLAYRAKKLFWGVVAECIPISGPTALTREADMQRGLNWVGL